MNPKTDNQKLEKPRRARIDMADADIYLERSEDGTILKIDIAWHDGKIRETRIIPLAANSFQIRTGE